jgi:Flp pilus assembly protein TadD
MRALSQGRRVAPLLLALSLCLVAHAADDALAQARALASAGKLADSESMLREYIQGHPSSAEAHFLLGYVLFRRQEAKESLAEFTAGAAIQRPHADELKIVASDYVILGDYGDADKWFTSVIVERPDDSDAWYLLGRAKFNESNFSAAVTCFQRALALRPRHVDAENNLGLAFLQLNENDKAEAAFQTAIDWQGETPKDAQPFLNLGSMYADQSKFDQSVTYLTKAAALAPDNPRIHEELARVYIAQQKLPEAQSELEKAVTLAPKISGLHFKLGQIYRKEGLRERAEQEFQICAQLNSTHSSDATPNPPH